MLPWSFGRGGIFPLWSISFHFYAIFLLKTVMCGATQEEWGARKETLLSGRAATELTWSYPRSRICLLLSTFNSLGHSLILVWTRGHWFCRLNYSPGRLLWVSPVLPALAFEKSPNWFLCPLTYPNMWGFVFCCFVFGWLLVCTLTFEHHEPFIR